MKDAFKYLILAISLVIVVYFIFTGESLDVAKGKEEETTKYSAELEESAELKAAYEFNPKKDMYSSYDEYKASVKAYSSVNQIDDWKNWKKQKDKEATDYYVSPNSSEYRGKTSGKVNSNKNDKYVDFGDSEETAVNLFTGEVVGKQETTKKEEDSTTTTTKKSSTTTTTKKNSTTTTTKKNSTTTTTKSSTTTTTKKESTTTTTKSSTTTTTKKESTTTSNTLSPSGQEKIDGVVYYVYYAKVISIPNLKNHDVLFVRYENDGYETYLECEDDDGRVIIDKNTVKPDDRVKALFKNLHTEDGAWRRFPNKIFVVK